MKAKTVSTILFGLLIAMFSSCGGTDITGRWEMQSLANHIETSDEELTSELNRIFLENNIWHFNETIIFKSNGTFEGPEGAFAQGNYRVKDNKLTFEIEGFTTVYNMDVSGNIMTLTRHSVEKYAPEYIAQLLGENNALLDRVDLNKIEILQQYDVLTLRKID